jgi:hypothetical protein
MSALQPKGFVGHEWVAGAEGPLWPKPYKKIGPAQLLNPNQSAGRCSPPVRSAGRALEPSAVSHVHRAPRARAARTVAPPSRQQPRHRPAAVAVRHRPRPTGGSHAVCPAAAGPRQCDTAQQPSQHRGTPARRPLEKASRSSSARLRPPSARPEHAQHAPSASRFQPPSTRNMRRGLPLLCLNVDVCHKLAGNNYAKSKGKEDEVANL